MAVLKAVESLKAPTNIRIYSDSRYVVDGFEKRWVNGWMKKGWRDVKNADIWKALVNTLSKHNYYFQWVKGHNGNTYNEECDRLAYTVVMADSLQVDTGYEQLPVTQWLV